MYDLGVDGETVFFVMEYVPGVSLETILKENPVLPVAQAARIVEQVVSGLEEAHRQGIVHRDVKPANVFMDERGRVKVGDFGIARVEGSELTQAGVGLGTPGYSAPEVLRGGTATARSDVFALGVLAYRLFSGKRPFQGTLPETLSVDILEHDPRPRTWCARRSEHVSDAIMRARQVAGSKDPHPRCLCARASGGARGLPTAGRNPNRHREDDRSSGAPPALESADRARSGSGSRPCGGRVRLEGADRGRRRGRRPSAQDVAPGPGLAHAESGHAASG